MRSIVPVAAIACALLATLPSSAGRIRRGPTAAKHKATKAAPAPAHQRAMDDARATQIQGALVKAGYMTEASGHWDSASEAAMQKLQADNGWQTKIIPDSRALIKLGLGPNSQAANTIPAAPGASSDPEVSGSK